VKNPLELYQHLCEIKESTLQKHLELTEILIQITKFEKYPSRNFKIPSVMKQLNLGKGASHYAHSTVFLDRHEIVAGENEHGTRLYHIPDESRLFEMYKMVSYVSKERKVLSTNPFEININQK